jgi:apolipoprotein N-acyltransferase
MLRQMKSVSPLIRLSVCRLKFKECLLCILSAVLLALSFSSFNLWIFAWFGFVPLFFAIENKSKGRAFLLAYLTGILFWCGTIYWLVHVTLLGTILLVLYLALYFGIFGIVLSSPYILHAARYLLFIPSIWVLLEYIRSHLFSGFGWALLGYSQYQNLPVIQIADITGVWGVSFLVMMANVAIYKIISGQWRVASQEQKYLPSLLLIFFVLSYGYYKLHWLLVTDQRSQIKVSVIQPNIPQELKWEPAARIYILEQFADLTKKAAKDKPDLIVWPEAANPEVIGEENQAFFEILNLAKEIKIPLLIGSVVTDGKNYFNSALLINNSGKITMRYDKLHLVPFGEYIPLKNFLPFLETVVPIGDMTPGKVYTIFKLPITFSTLICFEDVFPELSRAFVKRGANFLVNITNDAWYKRTSASSQHLQASVFRAIENRVYLARAANTGISGFVAPSGKVISRIKNGKHQDIFIAGFKTESIAIPKSKNLSFYTRYGDIFIFLLLFFVIYSIFRLRQ